MLKGLYKAEDRDYSITVEVKEASKSYIITLIENNSRFSLGHIDMIFKNSNKVLVRKEKSKHGMRIWGDDSFTLYPFKSGIPFYFSKCEKR